MIYVGTKLNEVAFIAHSHTETQQFDSDVTWQSRWDWKDKETVDNIAAEVTKLTGELYIGTDAGSSTSPRYDVQRVPKVGDEVSMGFNGDYYPVGKVVSISPTLRKITVEGEQGQKDFYRVRETGCWKHQRTWSLLQGHHDERNPHL